jgi:hypothetical protein
VSCLSAIPTVLSPQSGVGMGVWACRKFTKVIDADSLDVPVLTLGSHRMPGLFHHPCSENAEMYAVLPFMEYLRTYIYGVYINVLLYACCMPYVPTHHTHKPVLVDASSLFSPPFPHLRPSKVYFSEQSSKVSFTYQSTYLLNSHLSLL